MSTHKKVTKTVAAIPPWYFLGFLLIALLASGLALRSNYARMDSLRQAVYTADREGGDVQGALQDLQAYVTTHMNTNLMAGNGAVYPPIQLQFTYERLVKERGEQTAGQNTAIYQQAQQFCEQQIPTGVSGSNRVACIQDYVQKQTQASPQAPIPDALYKFSFVSPRWSPDLAGWLLVLTAVLLVATVVSFIAYFRRKK